MINNVLKFYSYLRRACPAPVGGLAYERPYWESEEIKHFGHEIYNEPVRKSGFQHYFIKIINNLVA